MGPGLGPRVPDYVFAAAARSEVGPIRRHNEDRYFAGRRVVAVADGVGGHAAGEVASAAAISAVSRLDVVVEGDPMARLREALLAANASIAELVAEDPSLAGMATTLTVVLLSGRQYAVASIGDSRTYLTRDGVLTQITRDDSYVQALVDAGVLTSEAAARHPLGSLVLQSLAGEDGLNPEPSHGEVRARDRFMLCSDGLSDVVPHGVVADTLRRIADRDACAERLMALALGAGGRDNVTVIVADVVTPPRSVRA